MRSMALLLPLLLTGCFGQSIDWEDYRVSSELGFTGIDGKTAAERYEMENDIITFKVRNGPDWCSKLLLGYNPHPPYELHAVTCHASPWLSDAELEWMADCMYTEIESAKLGAIETHRSGNMTMHTVRGTWPAWNVIITHKKDDMLALTVTEIGRKAERQEGSRQAMQSGWGGKWGIRRYLEKGRCAEHP